MEVPQVEGHDGKSRVESPLTVPGVELWDERDAWLNNLYLNLDKDIKFGSMPKVRDHSLRIHTDWGESTDPIIKFNVLYHRAKDCNPGFDHVAIMALTNFLWWNNAKRFPLPLTEDGVPYNLLYTKPHPNLYVVAAQGSLGFLFYCKMVDPEFRLVSDYHIRGYCRSYRMNLQVAVRSPDSLPEGVHRETLDDQGRSSVIAAVDMILTSRILITIGYRHQILQSFPGWSEADGLQILTTPYFRRHLLHEWRHRIPLIDLDKSRTNPPEFLPVTYLSLGYVTLTAFPSRIDMSRPWVMVDNQMEMYSIITLPDQHRLPALSLLPETQEPLPQLEAYLTCLTSIKRTAIDRGLYFRFNDMTSSFVSHSYVKDFLRSNPRDPIAFITAGEYRVRQMGKEVTPIIASIAYGIPKYILLHDAKAPGFFETLLDKAKLEVLKIREPRRLPILSRSVML